MQLQNVSSVLKSLRMQGRSRVEASGSNYLGTYMVLDVTQSRLVDSLECFKVTCVEFSEYSSILRMKAAGSSKTRRPVYQTLRHHVVEYRNLQQGPTVCPKKLLYVSGASLQLRTSGIIFHRNVPESSRLFLQ
jgi:hypothetical protein